MPTLNELALKDDAPQNIDYDKLPEQGFTFPDPPYPGRYLFKLPTHVSHLWDVFESKDKDGNLLGQRVKVSFDKNDSLTIVKALAGTGTPHEGEAFFGISFDNSPRPRGKEKIPISDMTYVLKALGSTAKPLKNTEFIKAFNDAAPGRCFIAEVEWGASCREKKPSYGVGPDGRVTKRTKQVIEGGVSVEKDVEGCGAVYYMGDWPKDPATGRYPVRTTCACGATLRAFPRLRNFEPAPQGF